MFENLETLAAFRQYKTSARTAVALRITQAAVSKRIAALERELGFPLLEKSGRNAVLSQAAEKLLENTEAPLAAIRESIKAAVSLPKRPIHLAVSDSIMAAWGGKILSDFKKTHRLLNIQLHVHRAPLAIQMVASGKYDLALCPSWHGTPKHLIEQSICDEPMVLLAKDTARLPKRGVIEVMTIEENSATWGGLDRMLSIASQKLGVELHIAERVESFSAVVQMARYGLQHGLVPLGLAKASHFPPKRIVDIFMGRVKRSIKLIATTSRLRSPEAEALRHYLQEQTDEYQAKKG